MMTSSWPYWTIYQINKANLKEHKSKWPRPTMLSNSGERTKPTLGRGIRALCIHSSALITVGVEINFKSILFVWKNLENMKRPWGYWEFSNVVSHQHSNTPYKSSSFYLKSFTSLPHITIILSDWWTIFILHSGRLRSTINHVPLIAGSEPIKTFYDLFIWGQ